MLYPNLSICLFISDGCLQAESVSAGLQSSYSLQAVLLLSVLPYLFFFCFRKLSSLCVYFTSLFCHCLTGIQVPYMLERFVNCVQIKFCSGQVTYLSEGGIYY